MESITGARPALVSAGPTAIAIVLIAIAISAAPAAAAATRAEYVAQVDPICRSAAKPTNKAAKRFLKELKRLGDVQHPSKKQARAFFNEIGRVLVRLGSIEGRVTSQIAAVPPAPGDEQTVSAWLQGRTQYSQLTVQAGRAFKHHKFLAAANLLNEANAPLAQEMQVIEGFGFQDCH